MSTLIEAQAVSAGYGSLAAVRDLDLHVDEGEVVALLGPNGAGKTTTIMTLAGVQQPLSGTVELYGEPTRKPLHSRARRGLALVPEERSVFMQLSTNGNLRLGRGAVANALDMFPELEPLLRRKAGLLSGGEQQILTLARALASEPRVLLADELSLGLAPLVVRRLMAAVRAAADRGVGVLLVEQQARQALEVADRAYVMRRGQIELQGPAKELAGQLADIEQSYLAGPDAERSGGTGEPNGQR